MPLKVLQTRLELNPIPPMDKMVVSIWHNDPIKAGEKVIISSKQYKKAAKTFEEARLVTTDYEKGFWFASATVLVLVIVQVISWWRRRKAAPNLVPTVG